MFRSWELRTSLNLCSFLFILRAKIPTCTQAFRSQDHNFWNIRWGHRCVLLYNRPPEIIRFHLYIQSIIPQSLFLFGYSKFFINSCKIFLKPHGFMLSGVTDHHPVSWLASYCLPASAICLSLRSITLELQWPEISWYSVGLIFSMFYNIQTADQISKSQCVPLLERQSWETMWTFNMEHFHRRCWLPSGSSCHCNMRGSQNNEHRDRKVALGWPYRVVQLL